MRVLFLDLWGGGTSLAYRMVNEGSIVKMWMKPDKDHKEEPNTTGDGFFQKVKDYNEWTDWADLIVADDGRLGKICDELRAKGKLVWGGTEWTDDIEDDRGSGQQVLKRIGMTVPESFEFKNPDQAIQFLKSNPGRYVVKPSGPIQDEKALTYVAKEDDGADMIAVLTNYKEKWAGKITKLELQEFKKGVEVGISGFFNGKDFLEPIEISFEHKKMFPGNIGPSSGEMGTSMFWSRKLKIYNESIAKMVPQLKQVGYIGYLDINCIATEKVLYPLEFTSRFGYPTIQLKMETIKEKMAPLMYRIASGDSMPFQYSNLYSICVVVATPPYPFSNEKLYKTYGEDQEVLFRTKDKTGIWPGEVRKQGDRWFIAGGGGFSVICTGQGRSIRDAKAMAYKRVESINIPNSFYRNDISDKTDEDIRKLTQWGWFRFR